MSRLRGRTRDRLVAVALVVMALSVTAQGAEARSSKVVRGVGTSWSPSDPDRQRDIGQMEGRVEQSYGNGLRRPLDLQPLVASGSSVQHRFTKPGHSCSGAGSTHNS